LLIITAFLGDWTYRVMKRKYKEEHWVDGGSDEGEEM
jgi:hypothetical protein